jgi:hypothetical protein
MSNLTKIVIGLIVVGLLLVRQLSGSESSIRQLELVRQRERKSVRNQAAQICTHLLLTFLSPFAAGTVTRSDSAQLMAR